MSTNPHVHSLAALAASVCVVSSGKAVYRPVIDADSNYMILQADLSYVPGAPSFGAFSGRGVLPPLFALPS